MLVILIDGEPIAVVPMGDPSKTIELDLCLEDAIGLAKAILKQFGDPEQN